MAAVVELSKAPLPVKQGLADMKKVALGKAGVCVSIERLNVNGISFDDGESVVGDAKEKVVIKCSVDQAEKYCTSSHIVLQAK
ncbi:hypothetical protein GH714_014424 [Hevea brasiliensis]|uniref:Uncharacterized protein n=1 Tax=Hevea brasiliensis TaxID=3981 RepID=A0A6A6LSF2_HEVBR|nr:hypothetical protein GH714_014424 [Hevea brasiliensis]